MTGLFDNIHPGLGRDDAIEILAKDFAELENQSDYYMAVSQLINFPCQESSDALIFFLQKDSDDNPVRLAQRKAVEVLARLKVDHAQLTIAQFLNSSDVYMVENVAWALAELNCQDDESKQLMIQLLDDPNQNQRVLIQSLSKLFVLEAVPTVLSLLKSDRTPVRGAAIAAIARLSGDRSCLDQLSDFLFCANQMDRQSAVQDVIDAGANDLIPSVLKAPVSPVFRLRAVRSLWEPLGESHDIERTLSVVDQLLYDDPRNIVVLHQYEEPMPIELLVEGLFHPDFSRCYLAMQSLLVIDPVDLWPHLERSWLSRAHNDYGAHYFMMNLFGLIHQWDSKKLDIIHEILLQAISDQRPQFKKSVPVAFLSYTKLFPGDCDSFIGSWLSHSQMPFWQCRYAALMVSQDNQSFSQTKQYRDSLNLLAKHDPDCFVRAKAQAVLLNA